MELTAQCSIPVGGSQSLELVWKGDDLPTGVTIASATKTVTPATGLTVGNPAVNVAQTGVTFSATAVTAGSYSILIVATRSDTYKNIALYHVDVPTATDRTTLAANALITVADLRGYMADESIGKNIAEVIINAISQEFLDRMDADLFSTTYTAEAIDGNGRSYLYLPHWPIATFTTCVENGVTLVKNTDYFVDMDNGILTKARTSWPTYEYQGKWTTARGGVVNTYTTGLAAVPADLQLACLKQCAVEYMRRQKSEWGQTSRSMGDGSVSLAEPGLLKDVEEVLDKYVRMRI